MTTSNSFYKWSQEDDNANDEKIYEELCYVTISSTFPSEVSIKLLRLCHLHTLCVCQRYEPFKMEISIFLS